MSTDARMVPVYLLAFILVIVLLLANVTMAANRTALDADHAVETLGEEGVYAEVTTIVQNDTVERVNETIEQRKQQRREERIGNRDLSDQQKEFIRQEIDDEFPDRDQQREFVTSSLTEEFVEGELKRNIRTVYAVLNNEQSDGQISIRVGRQQEQINQSIRETLQDDSRVDEDEIIQLVARDLPAQQNITENGTVPSQVTGASATVGLLNTLNLVFPALAVVLFGGMFFFTGRDGRLTARFGGVTLVIGGILGAVIGFFGGSVATGATKSALDPSGPEFAAMSDGIVAIVGNMFSTIVTQGLVIAAVGVIAVCVVFVEQRGYLGSLRSSDTQNGQSQYQQNHQYQQDGYQEGQYQQEQSQYGQQEESGQDTQSDGQFNESHEDDSEHSQTQSNQSDGQGNGQLGSDENADETDN